jgi:hypothetical protein
MLVADGNVILSAIFGGRPAAVFAHAAAPPTFAAAHIRDEVLEWLPVLARKRKLDLARLLAAFQNSAPLALASSADP